jgi:hypothetical protein
MRLLLELPTVVQQDAASDVDLSALTTCWVLSLWGESRAGAPADRLSCDIAAPVDASQDGAHPCRSASTAAPDPRVYAFDLPSDAGGEGGSYPSLSLRLHVRTGDGTLVGATTIRLDLSGMGEAPRLAATRGGSRAPTPLALLPNVPARAAVRLLWPACSAVHLAADVGITWLTARPPAEAAREALDLFAQRVPALIAAPPAAATFPRRTLVVAVNSLVEIAPEVLLAGRAPQQQLASIGLSQYTVRTLVASSSGVAREAPSAALVASVASSLRSLRLCVALCRGSGELASSPQPLGRASLIDGTGEALVGVAYPPPTAPLAPRWRGAWNCSAALDLPAEEGSDLHLLLYTLAEGEEGAAPPVCVAFAFMRLFDAAGAFLGSPTCSLVSNRGHTDGRHLLRFTAPGVARFRSSLVLYPGSPPFLPVTEDGGAAFSPSASTVVVARDVYIAGGTSADEEAGPCAVPVHLRLLSPVALPSPQPSTNVAWDGVGESTSRRPMRVILYDAGRCQAAGLFPHAASIEVVIVDGSRETVADGAVRAALQADSDSATAALSSTRRSAGGGLLSLLSLRGDVLRGASPHDLALQASRLAAGCADAYRLTAGAAGQLPRETAVLGISRSLDMSGAAAQTAVSAIDFTSALGMAVLRAAGASLYLLPAGLAEVGPDAGGTVKPLASTLLSVIDVAGASAGASADSCTSLASALGPGLLLSAFGLSHALTVSSLSRLKACRLSLSPAVVAASALPPAVASAAIERERARLADVDLTPADGASNLRAIVDVVSACADLSRGSLAWAALLRCSTVCPDKTDGDASPPRCLQRSMLQASFHLLLQLVADAAYCCRALMLQLPTAASDVRAVVLAALQALLRSSTRVVEQTGRAFILRPADTIDVTKDSVKLWAQSAAALVVDLSGNLLSTSAMSSTPMQPAAGEHAPAAASADVVEAALGRSDFASANKSAFAPRKEASDLAGASVLDRYRAAAAGVGNSLVLSLSSSNGPSVVRLGPVQPPRPSGLLQHRVGGLAGSASSSAAADEGGDSLSAEEDVELRTVLLSVSPRRALPRPTEAASDRTRPIADPPSASPLRWLFPFPLPVGFLGVPLLLRMEVPSSVGKDRMLSPVDGAIVSGLAVAVLECDRASALQGCIVPALVRHLSAGLSACHETCLSGAELVAALTSAARVVRLLPQFIAGVDALLYALWQTAGMLALSAVTVAKRGGAQGAAALALRAACCASELTQLQLGESGGGASPSMQAAAAVILQCGMLLRSLSPLQMDAIDAVQRLLIASSGTWGVRSQWGGALSSALGGSVAQLNDADDIADGFVAFAIAARDAADEAEELPSGFIPAGASGSGLRILQIEAAGYPRRALSALIAEAGRRLPSCVFERGSAAASPSAASLLPSLSIVLGGQPGPSGLADGLPCALSELVRIGLAEADEQNGATWTAVAALMIAIAVQVGSGPGGEGGSRSMPSKPLTAKPVSAPTSGGAAKSPLLHALDTIRVLALLLVNITAVRLTRGLRARREAAALTDVLPWTRPVAEAIFAAEVALSSNAGYGEAAASLIATGIQSVAPAASSDKAPHVRFVATPAASLAVGSVTMSIMLWASLRWGAAAAARVSAGTSAESWLLCAAAAGLSATLEGVAGRSSTILGGAASFFATLASHFAFQPAAADPGHVPRVLHECCPGLRAVALTSPSEAAASLLSLAWSIDAPSALHYAAAVVVVQGGRRYTREYDKASGGESPSGVELASHTPDSEQALADSSTLAHALAVRAHVAYMLWDGGGLSEAAMIRETRPFTLPLLFKPGQDGASVSSDVKLRLVEIAHAKAFSACLGSQSWELARLLACRLAYVYSTDLRRAGINPRSLLDAPHPSKPIAVQPTLEELSSSPSAVTKPVQTLEADGKEDVSLALASFASRGPRAGTLRRDDLFSLQTQATTQKVGRVSKVTAVVPAPAAPADGSAVVAASSPSRGGHMAGRLADAMTAAAAAGALVRRSAPTDKEVASWAALDRWASDDQVRPSGGVGAPLTLCGALVQMSASMNAGVPTLPQAAFAAVCMWGRSADGAWDSSSLPQPTWRVLRLPLDMSVVALADRLRTMHPSLHVHGPGSLMAVASAGGGELVFCGAGTRVADCRLAALSVQQDGSSHFVAPRGLPPHALFVSGHLYVLPAMPLEGSSATRFRVLLMRAVTLDMPHVHAGAPLPPFSGPCPSVTHEVRSCGPVLHANSFKLHRDVPDALVGDVRASAVAALDLHLSAEGGAVGQGLESALREWAAAGGRGDKLLVMDGPLDSGLPPLSLQWLTRVSPVTQAGVCVRPISLLDATEQWTVWAAALMRDRLAWIAQLRMEKEVGEGALPARGLFAGPATHTTSLLFVRDARELGMADGPFQVAVRAAVSRGDGSQGRSVAGSVAPEYAQSMRSLQSASLGTVEARLEGSLGEGSVEYDTPLVLLDPPAPLFHFGGADAGAARARNASLSDIFGTAEADAEDGEVDGQEATAEEARTAAVVHPPAGAGLPPAPTSLVRYEPPSRGQLDRDLAADLTASLAALQPAKKSAAHAPLPAAQLSDAVSVPVALSPGSQPAALPPPTRDYAPATSLAALIARAGPVGGHLPALIVPVPPPANSYSIDGSSTAFGIAVVPAVYAARVLGAGLEVLLYAPARYGSGSGWACPAGAHAVRALLSDYAEVKALEREKATTELRREWCRAEDAARTAGRDTDGWAIPDWQTAVPRSLHSRLPRLEGAWAGLAATLSQGLRLHTQLRGRSCPQLAAGLAGALGGHAGELE